METFETNVQSNDSIAINDEIKDYLLESAKWAKFLSILGFIGLGLIALASILIVILGSSSGSYSNRSEQPAWIVFIYITLAVVYYFPINYLFQFSTGVKRAINSNNQESFTSGFKNLKSHYRFVGIMSIVVLSIYVLIIIISMLMVATR